jgi:Fe2+ transport system protein B
LTDELGVRVVPASARYGKGLDELRQAISDVTNGKFVRRQRDLVTQAPVLKQAVEQLSEHVCALFPGLPNSQWVALQLLDGDERITRAVRSGELGSVNKDMAIKEACPGLVAACNKS